nr:lon protease homolog 1, mitochondrial-like [Tanacetum cinerariifolium]
MDDEGYARRNQKPFDALLKSRFSKFEEKALMSPNKKKEHDDYTCDEKFDVLQEKQILDEDHYGLSNLKEMILEFIAVGKVIGTSQGNVYEMRGSTAVLGAPKSLGQITPDEVEVFENMISGTGKRPKDILMISNEKIIESNQVEDGPTNFALMAYSSTSSSSSTNFEVKNINGEAQLHAKMDGKKVVISEASIRRELWFGDERGIDCLPNETIFEQLTLTCAKTTVWNEFSNTIAYVVICLATDQKFNFSMYIFDSMVKNLDSATKILMFPRFVQVFLNNHLEEMANHTRIYVLLSHTKKIFGNMKRVGKGFSGRDTPLFPTMMVQAQEELDEPVNEEMYDSLERAITTATGLDAEDEDIFGVNDQDDTLIFDADKDLQGEVVVIEEFNANSIATTTTAATTPTISMDEITLAKALIEKNTSRPKAKGLVMQEPSETPTPIPIVSSQQPSKVQEKGKGIIVEELLKIKKKNQILFDEEVEEQEQSTDAEKAKLFMEFIEKRRKFFAAKRNEERRKKPPTKAQQRSLMSTYLKNMDGWKTRALENKSFVEIKDVFEKAMIRINNFVDFRTELVEESTKKSQAEIAQERKLKRCLEIVPDDGDDVTIDATPVSSKSPTIVDYKIYKEGRKSSF